VFVGLKMTASHWYHMNTYVSLAIILTMLTTAIVMSIRRNKRLGLTFDLSSDESSPDTHPLLEEETTETVGSRK
jgi:predicted tellurium resistance membrane protein TerC